MKKLAEFTGASAVGAVAELLPLISKIAANPENKLSGKGVTVGETAGLLLKNNPDETMAIIRYVSEKEEYEPNATQLMVDVLDMLTDPDMMALFGLRSRTRAKSGSASGSTAAQTE